MLTSDSKQTSQKAELEILRDVIAMARRGADRKLAEEIVARERAKQSEKKRETTV